VRDLVEKINAYEVWDEASSRDHPMMNFSTWDLVRHAETAGFSEVHSELFVDVEPGTWVVDWGPAVDPSPNPNGA
jgi:hypothetical protein